ncbi:efflux RND transporter permease subunit [Methylotenera sp.]|uniref:efflux RND transporter permease subunit n=1 Tax=Methylotenera sp. TaxID=2051956 RepID=UPI002715F705|nr:CusA/CzcA family heavy metal efflux RND transporter [Methylotenera sp.]MDO9203891.1 CusA/CzcA family heavy metal efflux RND transporter [Methylotenera sp.]MDP1522966.1 CusA/CzcA family heavy metal efflux RND transporter [Methylotenera sp.]MDP2229461.1 CusA/CzcA family heavy metal efflux RND transporter [Methylotenera sp.]MDP3307384.1 CusA/CzcA family heavy metal efflux RND transporter [Methylotenera sp.]MDP3819276.1 CusA/CzcA family heavy metal efflux RND transporter [Methylotenera sp.]
MLAKLIQFALTQRLLMLILTLGLAAAGTLAYQSLPIDAFPDVSSTQVKIIIKAPGMTPEEVEARITAPIEVEMLGIPHQAGLRAVAKYALTDITVDFEDGTDIYWARQQVAERLNAVWGNLPADISGGMAPLTTPLGEMFMFTVENDTLSLQEKRSLLDWVIRPQLRTVPGVADVNALGGLVRSFEIVPDNSRMYARGVAIDTLQNVLENNNRNGGAGRLNDGEGSLLVRAEGGFKTIEDVQNTIVRSEQGMSVKIADIADVRVGSLTRYGAVTSNGTGEVVEGLVLGLRGANAQKLVEGVKAKLAEIAPSLPKGTNIHVFYDRGNLVERAVHTVTKALLEAVVLVLILLVLFLGNFRAALTIAFILPLSALFTFLLMRYFGMSANLMSLGGLTIAIGMLVDAAVVVVENIVSHLADTKKAGSLPRMHIIYRAVREVSVPVTAGVLIIITVFLPLLTLQGLEGKLFTPVALTIMFALAGSLFLSLTVIPVLASFLLKEVSHEEPWLVRKALSVYEPILKWSLDHAKIIVIGAFVLLAITGVAYTQIGKTFMPTMDEGDIIIGVEKLPSINLQQSLLTDMNVQRAILSQVPEVKGVFSRVGSDELGLDPMGLNQTDNFLILKPSSEWRMKTKEELIDELRKVMAQMPGLDYSFTQPIDMRVNEMILGVRGDLAIKIFGPDLTALDAKAQQIIHILESIKGSQDVYTPQNSGVQYLQIKIDRVAAGRLGLSIAEIENILLAQLEGKQMGIVQEGQKRTPVLLRGSEDLRSSPSDFGNLMLTLANGTNVPLSAVAKIVREEGPVKVDRERGVRMVVVTANIRDRDLVSFVDEVKQRINTEVKLGEGYSIKLGGQFENQQRAAARLAIVVPVAIGLIFLLLFATFGSIKQSLLILSNIPFAMIGGVFGLWISGEYLSVPASVGFIALLGIAVLNGVVMVSYFNLLEAQGMDKLSIVVEGAKRRLRPVLMTASIAAFGLIPLLFATGPGSEIQKPLAIVVIGGLVSSTALTLVLLPIFYRRFFK